MIAVIGKHMKIPTLSLLIAPIHLDKKTSNTI